MGFASDLADARMALVKAPTLDLHSAYPGALAPLTTDDRLRILESDRDTLIEGAYWAVGIFFFILIIGALSRGRY